MASLIGIHATKNGIQQIPSRAILSLNGNGLGANEQHPDTIRILRDTRVFPDGEAPPDFNSFMPGAVTWQQYGEYWYSGRTEDGGNFRAAWNLNEADYYQIQNEQGGNDTWALQRLVDIERAISRAANADGRKCCVLNLAGGSPGDFELWKTICAPFIVEAWENGGNVYGRHCYSDKFVNDDGSIVPGQPQRIIDELEYLKSIGYTGGMVLTECGLNGGYGVASYDYFEQQATRWEATLRPYADIFIGLCWWEMGESGFEADYTAHMRQLIPYLEGSYLEKWEPPTVTPPDNGGGSMTKYEWLGRITTTKAKNYVRPGFDAPLTATHARINFHKTDSNGKEVTFASSDIVPIPDGTTSMSLTQYFGYEDEPENPNPPPVVLTLPQGSKGVDLSNYQAGFFDIVSPDDFDFFIFRCSDGMNTSATSTNHDAAGVDLSLWEFADVGHASGKPWGIYHFLRPGNVEGQIDKVRSIYEQLVARGTPPRTAVFDDGKYLPGVWADVEDSTVTNAQVKQFCAGVGIVTTTGIYTGYYIWNAISSGIDSWWNNKPLWVAAYSSANDGTIPDWPDGPFVPDGWDYINNWQYSSEGQNVTDWTGDGLDMNIMGPYPPNKPDPPTPPPTGEVIDLASYQVAHPTAFRVMKVVDKDGNERGEDVQDMDLGNGRMVLRKNVAGEWYRFADGYRWRERDTSAEPGRYYVMSENGIEGGKTNPTTIELGKLWTAPNSHHVQYRDKDKSKGCPNSDLYSGFATDSCTVTRKYNVTFNTYGQNLTFDEVVYVTGGETQMYGVYNGIKCGWIGWVSAWGSAEIVELYFDRGVLTVEPDRWCE